MTDNLMKVIQAMAEQSTKFPRPNRIVVLMSGMDSYAAYLLDKRKYPEAEFILVHLDYGQKNAKEELRPLPDCDKIAVSNLFPSEVWDHPDLPKLDGRETVACLIAATRYAPDRIITGRLLSDLDNLAVTESARPWCWLMETVIEVSLGRKVQMAQPLVDENMTKADVLGMLNDEGVDLSQFVSCYEHRPCGKCFKCRTMASLPNDLKQKTRYRQLRNPDQSFSSG